MPHDVPHAFLRYLQGKPVDTVVYSSRIIDSRKRGIINIIAGLIINGFTNLFIIPFLVSFLPFFIGFSELKSNPQLENNGSFALFAVFMIALLILLNTPGIIFTFSGIKHLLKKGQWVAITNKELITFYNGSIKEYPWQNFQQSLDVKIHKNGTHDIILTKKKYNFFEENIQFFSTDKNGKTVKIYDIPIYNNKIGIMDIRNGEIVANLIRANMKKG